MEHPDSEGTRIDIGFGRLKSLEDLVDGWDRHVRRLVAEGPLRMSDDSPERVLWGVHDYAAALHLRDFVDIASQKTGEVPGGLGNRLAAADNNFRTFTRKDLAGWLPRAIPEAASRSGWWWRRIPNHGPVADELRRLCAAVP